MLYFLQPHECWETTPFSENHSCQKGLFLDRVLISPRTEKALAAAVTKLMAPMARVACGDREVMRRRTEDCREGTGDIRTKHRVSF